jgi:tetratricopeptide (TPR) repeat protein
MVTHNVEIKSDRKLRPPEDVSGKNQRSDSNADAAHIRDEGGHGWQSVTSNAPSRWGAYVFTAVVGIAFGAAGAWGYWHFFGLSNAKDEAAKSKTADSTDTANSAQQKAAEGKLRHAHEEWKTAMADLRQAQTTAHAARRSEEDTQGILDFFKKNLLSAGRSGDGSLTAAFWSENLGKNVTLRQAVDRTEGQVAESFVDRPQAEASVREMIGLAYLNLKDPAQAVAQYERALALREAAQGQNDPETATCRNQLAVAYRLAGRTAEASRLFDRNDNSPTHASALFIRGSMLLFEKNAPEAELKLRACLTIRQKVAPKSWATFDTMSTLGEALLDQQKFADAEPLLIAGYDGLKEHEASIPEADRSRLTKATERLLKLYESSGKKDKAMRWRVQLESGRGKKPE